MNAAVTQLRQEAQEPAPNSAPHVYTAIASVMAALSTQGIAKNRRSGEGDSRAPKFNFRGIDDVYNSLSVILAENHLVVIPRVLSRECVERTTSNGGRLAYTTVEVEFDLISALDGSRHTARTVGEAMDSSDKSSNKAMSAAYKYMAFQTFCIPTEGDNDADASTHEVVPKGDPRKPPEESRQGHPTLKERADRLERALNSAEDESTLDRIFALASGLCADMSTAMPRRLKDFEALIAKRKAEFKAAASNGGTPFDDEIPF